MNPQPRWVPSTGRVRGTVRRECIARVFSYVSSPTPGIERALLLLLRLSHRSILPNYPLKLINLFLQSLHLTMHNSTLSYSGTTN
jgi:hypothetical protein